MENNMEIHLISQKDQISAGCVNYKDIFAVIEEAFRQYHRGNIILPEKISQIFNNETQDRINCMPSTLLENNICGVKWVSVFPNNPKRYAISNVSGIIVLSEIKRGYPFAVMDGTLITALRTACMGAIGAKYLARKNSTIYGSIGAGVQARAHFKAIKYAIPNITTCYVASRTEESEKDFISELSTDYCDVEFIPCHSDYFMATNKADIIVTAVSCQKPLLKSEAIKPGAFYCHVGGWEDDYSVPLKAKKIICDNWDALKHRGSPTIARLFKKGELKDDDIYANLDEIICGDKPGRESDEEFIYFNSIGLSFVDIAVAYSFYKKAISKGYEQLWEMI
ncbi:hypothetical protein JNO48_09320 [Clostridiales bacterium]|nr:hypothetical protein JNO48_09320 [Clostridiales bacterium]